MRGPLPRWTFRAPRGVLQVSYVSLFTLVVWLAFAKSVIVYSLALDLFVLSEFRFDNAKLGGSIDAEYLIFSGGWWATVWLQALRCCEGRGRPAIPSVARTPGAFVLEHWIGKDVCRILVIR